MLRSFVVRAFAHPHQRLRRCLQEITKEDGLRAVIDSGILQIEIVLQKVSSHCFIAKISGNEHVMIRGFDFDLWERSAAPQKCRNCNLNYNRDGIEICLRIQIHRIAVICEMKLPPLTL
jgi:hypothetical protein